MGRPARSRTWSGKTTSANCRSGSYLLQGARFGGGKCCLTHFIELLLWGGFPIPPRGGGLGTSTTGRRLIDVGAILHVDGSFYHRG